MSDLISIIIPIYNRAHTIRECIQSIEAQSFQNYEIILIDDGSSDQTIAVCSELTAQNPRITLLRSGHVGVSAARNIGLEHATGEYVFFMDSDDIIHPLLLSDLLGGIKRYSAEIAGSDCLSFHNSKRHQINEIIAQNSTPGEVSCFDLDAALNAVFHRMTPLNMIGGVMMRRDLIGETRFRADLFIGEDFYFVYQNLIKSTKCVFLKEKRYYARLHDGNTSWQYDFPGFWTRFYRRELVWETEASFGRKEHADIQKQQAFGIFLMCLERSKPDSEDRKKMSLIVKKYKSTLLPVLSRPGKIKFYLAVYAPNLYCSLLPILNALKKLQHK